MDISVEASKYKEKILLAPLDAKMKQLSGDKQLALCLMSLERLYTTYFVKYDKKGAKNFSKLLNILEQSLFAGEVPETDIVEQLADWCDQCVDKMDDGRISEWKQCAIEILFSDCLCQFVESLAGICRQKNPFEFGDIYQIEAVAEHQRIKAEYRPLAPEDLVLTMCELERIRADVQFVTTENRTKEDIRQRLQYYRTLDIAEEPRT